jgi:uracil-DNA glycosylase
VTTWQELADSAASCTRCDLYKRATATVFGEGRTAAGTMVLVGEEPGDQEDKQGRPFVGPAGRVLDRALREDDPEARERSYAGLVADLVAARDAARR